MPIPKKHLDQLEKLTKTRREQLRIEKKLLKIQEKFLELGEDRKVLNALNELADNPGLRKRISKNPRRYFVRKGIRIPRGAIIKFKEGNWSIKVRVEAFGHSVEAGYSSDSGGSLQVDDKDVC